MNGQKSKKLMKLVKELDAKVLLAVRNKYGEQTNSMDEDMLYKAAKKLYKCGKIKI